MSKQHGAAMFQKRDASHLKAMNKMQELMKKPEAIQKWFENNKKKFEALHEEYQMVVWLNTSNTPNNRLQQTSAAMRRRGSSGALAVSEY